MHDTWCGAESGNEAVDKRATDEPVGTVVVDPSARFLYLVGEGGTALRYGIGVGKVEAFDFAGVATVGRKAEWPGWRPTDV